MLRTRLITAAVAIPPLFVVITYGPGWIFAGVVFVFPCFGLYEYFCMAFPERLLPRYLGWMGGALIAGGMTLGPRDLFGAALAAAVVMGLLFLLWQKENFPSGVTAVAHSLLGMLYIGFLFPHYVWLRQGAEGIRWVLFTLLVVFLGDTGGYFAGRYGGRRKLMPDVSPAKTLEGVAGSFVGNFVAGTVTKAILFPLRSGGEIFGLALFLGLLGQLGDLCESALKRAFGAKDSGRLLPGHGGVLDRMDSLLFPGAFVYYYVTLWR